MPRALIILGVLAISLATLALSPVSAHAVTKVSGKLKGGRGYTVIGVTTSGSAVSTKADRQGKFKLRFKGR